MPKGCRHPQTVKKPETSVVSSCQFSNVSHFLLGRGGGKPHKSKTDQETPCLHLSEHPSRLASNFQRVAQGFHVRPFRGFGFMA